MSDAARYPSFDVNSPAGFVRRAVTSQLGAKVVMAVTGLVFFGWLCTHLLGNFGVFAGPETENTYAHFLKGNPEILWAQRLVWMLALPIHIVSGLRLAALNRAARPQPYASPRRWRQASLASRTMAVSGLIVLAFVTFHIFHFTWIGIANTYFAPDHVNPVTDVADVYGMVVTAFHIPWVAGVYVVGVTLLGWHLSHGLWSGVQTLGLNGHRWTPIAKKAGFALAVLIAIGFALIPLSIVFGVVGDSQPQAVLSSASPSREAVK